MMLRITQNARAAAKPLAAGFALVLFLTAFPHSVSGQMAIVPAISTVAGNGTACAASTNACGDGGAATSANLNNAQYVFADAAGNLYIADNNDNRVRKVSAITGEITTIAGNGTQCSSPTASCGDGGAATSANLYYPNAVVVDSAGNIYIADRKDNRVRKVSATTGYISTVAGNGTACANSTSACGDGGAATSANLNTPIDLALDASGNLYIADYGDNKIRKVAASNGYISTVGGTGNQCSSPTASCGDGGAATSANLTYPRGIAFDSAGNGYVSDYGDNRIRKVSATTGYISTIAGTGTVCSSATSACGDGGAATSANLNDPANLVVDAAGDIYFSDYADMRIRRIAAVTGIITTVAGTGTTCALSTNSCGDGAAATSANFNNPTGVSLDVNGNLYSADAQDNRIRKIDFTLSFPETAIGSSSTENALLETTEIETISSFTAQVSQGSNAEYTLGSVTGCTVNGVTQNASGELCTVPITFSPAYPGSRNVPLTVVTGDGNVTFGMNGIGTGPLVALMPGIISTVAGNGVAGYTGNGGAATGAEMNSPQRIAVDNAGNIYIADQLNNVIRKVTASTGYISTVAGTGTASYSGDGGAATAATLNNPVAIALDTAGNLYITDQLNNRIREVSAATGIITTVAGNGSQGYSGDGGAATSAELYTPYYTVVDPAGNLDIVDGYNCRIRRVTISDGVISTIAGTGTCGYSGDGGAATSAELNLAGGIAVDNEGNLYIADTDNYRIRKVAYSTGLISTVAGDGTSGYSGDGAAAASAEIGKVEGIAVDTVGNLYIPDGANHRVRRVDAVSGIITTIAGTGTSGYTGDGGAATKANLKQPYDIAIDGLGALYVADLSGEVVRKVTGSASALTFPTSTPVGSTDSTDDPQTVTLANIGNIILTTSVPSSGSNPSVAAYFAYDASSTCPQLTSSSSPATLGSGDSCTVAIDFAPTATGSVSGSAVLTNNSLSSAGSEQSIGLSATAAAGSTTTTVSSSGTPSTYGSSVTFTATVALTVGSELPLGTVQFSVNGVAVGSAVTLNGSGQATYTTSALATGTDSITAVYTSTSSNFTGSSSSAFNQVVNKASSSATITWGTPASISYGTALSATQLDATSTLAGSFVYSPAAGTVPAIGSQTLSVTFTPTDTTDYNTGTASVTLTVTDAVPTVTLTTSASTLAHGSALTLTATVASGATAVHPGVITFCDANYSTCLYQAVVGKAQLTSSGTASIKIVPGIGSRSYKAVFAGNTTYAAATSASQAVSVTGPFSTTSTISSSGSAGNYTLTDTVVSSGDKIVSPTGTVAFEDTSNASYTVASATVGSSTVTQTFSAASSYSTIAVSRDVAVADFNGDGIPDMAIVDQSGQKVYILLGNGDGTFTAASGSPVTVSGSILVGIAAGDFNNNGGVDLAVVDYGDNKVFILLGNGDGTFQSPTSFSVLSGPVEVAVADFNNDGNLDLAVVGNAANQVEVLEGNGSGGFTEWGTFATGSGPYSIAAADVNNDGNLDIVVGNNGASSVTVLLGNGAGSFTQPTGSPFAAGTNPSPSALVIGDFNGDGKPDLAVADSGSTTVSVLLGNGDGTFGAASTLTAQSGQKTIAMADFNGDGNQDLATCDTSTGTVYKFSGNGNGTFQSEVSTSTGTAACSSMAAADFNGDGNPDLVVPMQGNNKAVVLLDGVTHTATASASSVNVPGTGTHNVEAVYGGDTYDGASTSSTTALTASKAATTLTLQASPTGSAYGASVVLTATLSPYVAGNLTTAGETITFKNGSTTLGTGTLSGGVATLTLTSLPTGSDSLTASYAGDSNFIASTSSALPFTVTKATPSITWGTPSAIIYGTALSSTQLDATSGGVAGSFVYSPTSGTVLTAGSQTLSVTFTPTDTTDYNSANGNVTLTVNKATPTITWGTPSAITYGTALSSTQLDASSGGVAGSFAYSPTSGTVLTAGSQTLSVTFTPTDTTDYNSANGNVTLTVNKATPTITWATPSAITYGTALSATQLDATSGGVAGSFAYSPTSGTVLAAGSQTLSVTFTPTDTTDYNTATGSVTLTVNKAAPTLSVASSANPSTYTGSVTFTATISSGPSGTITFYDSGSNIGTGTISGTTATFTTSALTAGSHTITAGLASSTDYNAVTSSAITQTVNKATPSISWANPSPISYGTALSSAQLDASSGGVAGSFVYTPAAGTVLSDGSQTLSVTFTPTDTNDYNSANASVTLTVDNKTTPTVTWSTPTPITYGTALSATQLNASSGGVAGTMAYSPAAGTVLAGGMQTLSVTFTPTDTTDYNTVVQTTTLTVNKASVVISGNTSLSPSLYGDIVTVVFTLSGAGATPTGTVTVTDGVTTLSTVPLSAGAATFSTSALLVGSHTLKASYNGDDNYE